MPIEICTILFFFHRVIIIKVGQAQKLAEAQNTTTKAKPQNAQRTTTKPQDGPSAQTNSNSKPDDCGRSTRLGSWTCGQILTVSTRILSLPRLERRRHDTPPEHQNRHTQTGRVQKPVSLHRHPPLHFTASSSRRRYPAKQRDFL